MTDKTDGASNAVSAGVDADTAYNRASIAAMSQRAASIQITNSSVLKSGQTYTANYNVTNGGFLTAESGASLTGTVTLSANAGFTNYGTTNVVSAKAEFGSAIVLLVDGSSRMQFTLPVARQEPFREGA